MADGDASGGPLGPDYPALPAGYVILAEADLVSLTDRVTLAESEVKRLNTVLDGIPFNVRVEAEALAACPKAVPRRDVVLWSCLDPAHRHESAADAQQCIVAVQNVG